MSSRKKTARRPAPAAPPEAVDASPTGGPAARTVALVLLIAGLVGFTASFVLAAEKFALLVDPSFTPSCTINATVSCTSVMNSAQSAAFGFPNPLLGIAAFAALATTGAALLGGFRLPRWYRAGLQVGVLLGLVFVGWLISQSLFVIKALCPYCMVVWLVTLTACWYVTLDNLNQVRDRLPRGAARALDFGQRNHVAVLALALLVVAGLVVIVALGF